MFRALTIARALASLVRPRREAGTPVRRILVAHYLLLGDTILLAPLLKSLAARYPDAERVVLARPAVATLFGERPYGVTVLPFDRRDAASHRAVIDSGPYDLAIVPDDNRYAWLARAAGARRVVGFANDRPGWKNWMLDRAIPYPEIGSAWADIAARHLTDDLAAAEPPPHVVGEWPAPAFATFARPPRPYVVLHIGASTPLKQWPAGRWVSIAAKFRDDGLAIVWSGGAGERHLLDAIFPTADDVDLMGVLDLPQLWHLLAGAQLLVCPDTGIAHLARLTGVPTVALFGPGSALIHGPGRFWSGSAFRTVTIEDFPCRDQPVLFRRRVDWARRCGRRFDPGAQPGGGGDASACGQALCMNALRPQEVVSAVDDMHEARPSGRAAARDCAGESASRPMRSLSKEPELSQRALLLLPGTMGFIRAVWFVVVPITMLGELTGLRNVGLSLVGLSTLIAFRHDESFGLPAARPWTLVLLWSTASLVWSGAFDITLAKLKVDLFLPFLMFWSAWVMSKEIGLVRLLAHGTVAGLVALALLSLFVWIPTEYVAFLPSRWLHTYASVLRPLPRWYPGVGDASTAALFAGIFLMGATVAGRISIRAAAVGCAALVVVVAATGNRNVLILLPVALLLMGWRIWQTASKAGPANRRSLMTRVVVFTSIALVTVVAAVLLEYSARERLVQLKEPLIEGESASMQLVARDTRPFIWRYYLRLGSEAPWIGVGFGRTVPGIVHHTERDEELARVENNAYIHAHNLLLDWWLQTGLIGVCLFALLIVTLYRRIFQQERAAREAIESADLTARGHRALATGAMVLITMMLLRNMTDDFMVFGIAAFFWMLLGAMMGESELSARRTR